MISVSEARVHLLELVSPLGTELVPLAEAAGRVLADDVAARRDQPPFAASAMDGYAVKSAEVELHAMFKVIGEAAAGHGFDGTVGAGQAVRIFTGAPIPDGADFVVIQEDVTAKGTLITITDAPGDNPNVRPRGGDFKNGQTISAPRLLTPSDIALLAAMNIAEVPVARKPDIALISTGDELVMPGGTPGPDQIIASNTFGLKAMLEGLGAQVRILPIARDTHSSLRTAFSLAEGADLIVTIGGASVGDHDLVGEVAADLGMERSFYKVAMRPGKPLMAGRLGTSAMAGLPGNPVSAMVCGHIFLAPMVRAMLGLPPLQEVILSAPLAAPLGQNGPREHYMRATLTEDGQIRAFERQDSALLTVLAEADALLIRPPHDPPREIGETMSYLRLI
ncbi:molybdopterin molybdotransferase MoeA [Phaeobacter gallaeciensis]|jgi:molybdopterin molybdotransferase|uniref:Molybdopterin molybdenumtransferase n=1 Tax=Phaeobacter gallaeciensis TaxID=60890 RepID=A0ABD4X4V8_9RHOB|nr:gephyrin-like molybdotransferase Glp [Phaeobacter gallaeciensis]MDE4143472.1 molybdopterin molybdotransferase MoeA [Phaeobacter gallaeciensis]MDE4156165.1 molybdopterin molybdotransferase MoeA [Phaeobacter gallaeciensis]MDE4160353.1 molybdopterin molybdotransferase MoeA [Phaeobacter gallaeciensis]MDE4164552.1 molybdopterin molybdotransferase MoeA [Phaeobacter gallaeciensis]MDE4168807.1 molybdopterin molybdotransferase MoeA [Phaeobacter gallaeciensis]